ncbi:MAG: heavy-metal-associated domain-containing protein [Limosilactobacillus sp.]|uniref:heavy-metal-associated domain-containing protein n=1 Tax=Limosilactobacillus sp. TaxID=2773925 RepID=UPI002A754E32|nr:heavy-metal-associated domain-containing protein [Limosilactobacillus sp.]MDY2802498.1 heavy-metal-associated domain-containing protein [Limosilactobacillus sp.]
MEKVMMKLGGLTCPSCLTKIQKSVESVDGTADVKVLFNAGKVKFTLDPAKTSTDTVQENIEKMGYVVQGVKTKEL